MYFLNLPFGANRIAIKAEFLRCALHGLDLRGPTDLDSFSRAVEPKALGTGLSNFWIFHFRPELCLFENRFTKSVRKASILGPILPSQP